MEYEKEHLNVLWRCKREMLRRKYSHKTIKTYMNYISRFLKWCGKDYKEISKKDARLFLEEYMDKEVSGNSMNVALNSIKFMMEEVMRKSMRLDIRYSKVPKRIPICLIKEEVKNLINAIGNEKQKLVISLMYGAGLRVSEVVKLKKEDVEIKRGIGWVRVGKGNKDRLFIIPETLIEKLQRKVGEAKKYVFEGNKGYHYSARSVQQIIKKAGGKAGIKKKISPHTLRHSFATHLIESGKDVKIVQDLLGHKNLETTMRYLHIANPKLVNVRSPLDEM